MTEEKKMTAKEFFLLLLKGYGEMVLAGGMPEEIHSHPLDWIHLEKEQMEVLEALGASIFLDPMCPRGGVFWLEKERM